MFALFLSIKVVAFCHSIIQSNITTMATNEEVEITTTGYDFPEEGECIDDELELLLFELTEGYYMSETGAKVTITCYESPPDFEVNDEDSLEVSLVYSITSLVPTSKWLLRCLSYVRGVSKTVSLACLMGYISIPEEDAKNNFENPELFKCDLELLFIMIAYGMTSPSACIINESKRGKYEYAVDVYTSGGLDRAIVKCNMSKVMIAKTISHWVFSTRVGMNVRRSLTGPPGKAPQTKKRKLEGETSGQSTLSFTPEPGAWKDRMKSNIDKAGSATTVALAQFTGGGNVELDSLMQRWLNIGLLKAKSQYGAFFAGTNVYGGEVFPKEDQESFSATFQRLWCIAQCTTQQQFPVVIGQFILMGGMLGDRLATGIGHYNVPPAVNTAMAQDDTGRELQELMKKIKLPPGSTLYECAKNARVTARAQGKSDCGLIDPFN